MKRCSAKRRNGMPCKSTIIVPDSDPPICRIHSLSPEEAKQQSARGGRRKGQPPRDRLLLEWDEVEWLLGFVVKVLNSTLSPSRAFEYLAPVICQTDVERASLRAMLEGIVPAPEEEIPSRLDLVRDKLEQLYYEGRVLFEELPVEVRERVDAQGVLWPSSTEPSRPSSSPHPHSGRGVATNSK